MKEWLTNERFWSVSGKWFAGLFCGLTFVLGLGSWREAFVSEPLQTVVVLCIPGIIALVCGAVAVLSYSTVEVEEQVTASWPDTELDWNSGGAGVMNDAESS
jgi:hypothetical protein